MVRLQSLFGLNTVDHSFQFLKGTSKKANTFLSKNASTLFVFWFGLVFVYSLFNAFRSICTYWVSKELKYKITSRIDTSQCLVQPAMFRFFSFHFCLKREQMMIMCSILFMGSVLIRKDFDLWNTDSEVFSCFLPSSNCSFAFDEVCSL